MAEKKETKSLFREKSIERIESPDKLNDYLRVTSPAVWVVLAAVIVLLVGVCIWGVLGHIDSTVTAAVISDKEGTKCLVPASALEGVVEYRTVTVEGQPLQLTPSVLEPATISEATDVYVLMAGDLKYGDVVYPIEVTGPADVTVSADETGAAGVTGSSDATVSADETGAADVGSSGNPLPEGIYVGELLIEEVSPMSLFFN